MNDLICIAGPTASGKTGLAVALAKALNGEVVSCDSMQIYRGMDVGTAKPTPEEMQGVPHHLLDVADPGEDFSVGRYVRLATEAITDIHSRGRTAIVAGGTGLYLDSLVKGEEFAPPSREGERKFLEDAAEQKGIEYVYDMLMEADPETAERLHLSDRKRIIRAMEVFLITGLPLSWHIAQSRQRPPRYRPAWLGLNFRDRAKLYARIDARVDQMLAQGLEQEVQRLLDAGVDPQTTAMQAIGYKELASALRGECTVEEAASRIKQASRNYAKRQLTWFRRNDKIRWIYPDETPDLLQRALKLLAREPD
ncbi:MAG: tRNA (adenosine(37)-N6)-dimethylallyltransferase MiaA [Oscillospiraceae bacterium]|jgi:tRNA dimethylallyltransferase|nr:tRNA (adenosine(37)-N6)-dimethylallyltransferase MiaA [Oscillospiraceae bacterium]MBQ2328387.1 tRNA (adenosine(37)-N6)-dimethylallyltransferase MiaA [Oscillospiraceae bacterium]MBQ5468427.1 tRNA (adenosine(37)-N6)-dimethylallyltransferase MiaA [Oscillospiraceae bacterium]MCR5552075.1 tRNA (adenosine(37)-N6)-dimethylallyltransferase MiaA [Oscillospiraceae bacterium]